MRFLESVTQLCMGIWVGSMTGFAVTAPMLFRAFGDDRQRAGDLAGEMIFRLTNVGLVLGFIALAALLPRLREGLNRWRAGLLALSLALALAGPLWIFPRLEAARPPRPIQEYALTDPIRAAYNRYHKLSERMFGVAILLGAGVMLLGPLGRREGRQR